jgi:hypothetical protein
VLEINAGELSQDRSPVHPQARGGSPRSGGRRGFVDVARTVGIPTVAKGIQSASTVDLLGRLQVDLMHHFLIHRPQPMDQPLTD